MIGKFRIWLLKRLFTQDEKYLIARAVDDRLFLLEVIGVSEKYIAAENAKEDHKDLKKLKTIFSTPEWN
jgi:hypothetical protein